MLFSSTGYELIVMPMITGDNQPPKVEQKPVEVTEAEIAEAEKVTEADKAVAEAEAITKEKPKKKSKVKQPVTA
jgi:hypothetical protein